MCYYKKKEDVLIDDKTLGYLLVENMVGVETFTDKDPGRFNVQLLGVDRQFELLALSKDQGETWVNAIREVQKRYVIYI